MDDSNDKFTAAIVGPTVTLSLGVSSRGTKEKPSDPVSAEIYEPAKSPSPPPSPVTDVTPKKTLSQTWGASQITRAVALSAVVAVAIIAVIANMTSSQLTPMSGKTESKLPLTVLQPSRELSSISLNKQAFPATEPLAAASAPQLSSDKGPLPVFAPPPDGENNAAAPLVPLTAMTTEPKPVPATEPIKIVKETPKPAPVKKPVPVPKAPPAPVSKPAPAVLKATPAPIPATTKQPAQEEPAPEKKKPGNSSVVLDVVNEKAKATTLPPAIESSQRKPVMAQPLKESAANQVYTPLLQPSQQPAKAPVATQVSTKITVVDIDKKGAYVLLTNPATRLPEKFTVGQAIFTGEVINKIDPATGKILLGTRTIGLQ